MGIPAPHRALEDWIIGEPDEAFAQLAAGSLLEDPQDFIVGDEQEIRAFMKEGSRIRRRSDRASRGDLRTISDLIAEELGQTEEDFGASVVPSVDLASRHEKPAAKDTLLELGEDGHTAHMALSVHQRIAPEIERLATIKSFPSKDREIIVETIRGNSAHIKEQQTILQDLIAQYIRQGEFQRVAAIDSVKRKLDELLLQIRVLENRITNRGAEIVSGSYVDGSSAQELFEEAQEDGATISTAKEKPKAKVERSPFRIPRFVKFAFVLALFALMPLGYYLSANWGVEKTVRIDVATYQKVLPLTNASGAKDAFHGIVADSWKRLEKKAKEDAIHQLGAMAKVDGYRNIFLMYASGGIAAIYNTDNDRIVVQ